jgi:transposase-like protein
MTSKRGEKGIELVVQGKVVPLDSSNFMVKSEQDQSVRYSVRWEKKRWTCTCEDFRNSGRKCKHVYAVCNFLMLRDTQTGLRQDDEFPPCPKCGKNDNITKEGFSESRSSGLTQRFFCWKCNRGFSSKMGFEGLRGQRMAVVISLDLYFRGLSLRAISGHFEAVYAVKVSHTAIYYWIKKYVELVSKYLEQRKIPTGQRWHADETVIRVQGRFMRLWSMLDAESRDLIAHHISESRDTTEAAKLIEKALLKSENLPDEIITDGLTSYPAAIDKKLGKELNHPTIHVQASIKSGLTNNRMERMQKTIKSRYKATSSFRSKETAQSFSNGFSIYYNNIKKHDALGGKTPNEHATQENGDNNWSNLIKHAKKI